MLSPYFIDFNNKPVSTFITPIYTYEKTDAHELMLMEFKLLRGRTSPKLPADHETSKQELLGSEGGIQPS